MAKTLSQSLHGLSPEVKKRIKDEIKAAQSAKAQDGNQKADAYWEGLSNISKEVKDLIVKAKADGSIPKGTTIDKLSKIPASKPKRWNALYNKLFGRKLIKTKPADASNPAPKKTPRKKTASKKA